MAIQDPKPCQQLAGQTCGDFNSFCGTGCSLTIRGKSESQNVFQVFFLIESFVLQYHFSQAAKVFESQLAESILEGDGQLAFKKLATATLDALMPRIEGKGEFGQARWRLVYAPQIPSLLSVDPTVDPLKSLASNISFGTEVEVQLGKRLQVRGL